jgi:hypothetical protein
VRAESDLWRKTFDNYAGRLRFIVSQLFDIAGKAKRHNYRTGGTANWVSAIDAVPLEHVTCGKGVQGQDDSWVLLALVDAESRRRVGQ